MELLLCLVAGAVALQVIYYTVICRYWLTPDNSGKPVTLPSLSIVICARNEAENLAKHLPLVLEQDYPDLEVWVVDDGSTDGTPKTLEQLKDQYSRLKTLRISPEEKQGSGKKFALQKGVEMASGDMVLLTDADCRPASTQWARKMAGALGDKAIVLGISPFEQEPGLTNSLAAYETALTAWQYIAYARAGSPYMGVGRNMGFTRTAFLAKKWTDEELLFPSGDDDLFIQTEATGANTATCTDPEAYTYSRAPQTWNAWYRQKKRHLSTGHTYRWPHRLLLGLFLFSKAMVYPALAGIVTATPQAGSLTICLLGYWACITAAAGFLHRRSGLLRRWYLAPFIDPAYVFSIIFTGIASQYSPQRTWK